jgi:hypothetical protein
MTASTTAGCAAPDQSAPLPASVDLEKETVITGFVRAGSGELVAGAYVRLLDATGEFTAEVVSSASGAFRFFASPGTWTVRALAPGASGSEELQAGLGFTETRVEIS